MQSLDQKQVNQPDASSADDGRQRYQLTFSKIDAVKPNRLAKQYSLDEKGNLVKKAGGCLVEGRVKTCVVSGLRAFSEALDLAGPATAFTYGVATYAEAIVTTQSNLAQVAAAHAEEGQAVVARDRKHFSWASGPGVVMFDYDPYPDAPPLTPDELLECLYSVWPALRDAPHMWRPSSSSCIVNTRTNEQVRGISGQRVYGIVADASDIPRLGNALVMRLWSAGLGRILFSKSGAMLERTVVDSSVWQPERLDFCGGAQCIKPLEQKMPTSRLFNPDAEPVDSLTLPDMTEAERKNVQDLKTAAKSQDTNLAKSEQVTAAWLNERIKDEIVRDVDCNPDKVRKIFKRAVKDHDLEADFPIHLSSGTVVTVSEILAHPDRYQNCRCADPLEPDYSNDARIALINSTAATPIIYSHAHGGITYRLLGMPVETHLVPGEIHLVIDQMLKELGKDRMVYERSGEVVRVTKDGRVFPACADWLSIHLTKILQLRKPAKQSMVATDCPIDIARKVLSMRGEYGLARLEAVLTAPTIALDGRILDEPGYDEATGLLLIFDKPKLRTIPRAPTRQEVIEALDYLWKPFKDFPFVSPADRSVMVTALLTAAVRPVLPTAPAFLFSATTAGSGKTLLTNSLAAMAGADEPAVFPPSDNEEETRKRMLAALREAKPVVIIDNVERKLESASICALLTSRIYSDRLLGSSLTLSVSTRALIMASGNNIALVGDLNRRFLTCTLDPATDKAYRRSFPLNPAEYTRNNRQEMVAAALTIIQGYRTLGSPMVSDRTASFEDWSDLVRQAVIWVGSLSGRDLIDPCDSIDASYDQDPETLKLQSLLMSWQANFSSMPKKVQQIIRCLPKPDALEDGHPLSDLFDAVDDIAGERGHINSRRLGRWIESMRGRVCGGKKFVIAGRSGGSNLWRVVDG